MTLFKKYFALALCVTALTGCFGAKEMRDLNEYQEEFKETNVNVFLKSFSDHRQGQALVMPAGPSVIYAYKPQSLANGQILPLLGYYLYHAADLEDTAADRSIGVDVSIRDIKTLIRSGNFASGRLGYYSAEVQARVILRDMNDNKIIKTFPIVVSKNQARRTTTGRSPSPSEDNYALIKLVDEVALELADETLEEVAEFTEEYYEDDSKNEEVFEYVAKDNFEPKVNPLDKVQDVEVKQVEETELKVTPEMISYIESEEQKLLNRKEEQRKMFEKKIEDQKYLDFLDSKQ